MAKTNLGQSMNLVSKREEKSKRQLEEGNETKVN